MLKLSRSDYQRMIDHCVAALPNEACGILSGRDGAVEKVHCMTNARPGPVSYEMDPAEQFRVLKEIRREGGELIAIFHSHPSSPAVPSGTDVEQAYWPGTLYPNLPGAVHVIISLMNERDPVVKGYTISAGTVTEIPLAVS